MKLFQLAMIVGCLVLLAANAMADENAPRCVNRSCADTNISQSQAQNQTQTQRQDAVADSEAFNDVQISNDYTGVKQAPDIVNIPSNNTAPCLGAWGIGVSGAGETQAGSALIGFPMTNKECMKAASAAVGFAQGNTAHGWRMTCSQKETARAYAGDYGKRFSKREQREATEKCIADNTGVALPVADYATKEELNRAFSDSVSK